MTPLESHKRLLIAESELNRAQMLADLSALRADLRQLSDRTRSLGAIVSSTATLVAGLAAFRRGKPADPDAKPSWLQTILKSASLVSTLWATFRPKDDNTNNP